MWILLTCCFFVADLAGAEPSSDQANGKTRLIIGFTAEASDADRSAILKNYGLEKLEGLDDFNAAIVETDAKKFKANAFRMMSHPKVYYVEEDFYINWLEGRMPASFQQLPMPSLGAVMKNLPKFEKKNATRGESPWGIVRVNAAKAWGRPVLEGLRVKVAVVDTGIDYTHPDLAANYAGGYNAIDSDKKPMDDQGHGTHVAGTIAAVKDGKGVVGVAPKARLYAVKVLDKNGGGRLTSIIKGIVWCARNDMDVANMSLGAPMGSLFMRLAVVYAESKGVAILAAAGNSGGNVSYPARYDQTIAISASDSKDKIAYFSSRGDAVDFIAPGVDVKSTIPGGGYAFYSGTSMATPHAAGLAALAVARGASGMDEVKAALTRAAKPLKDLKPTEQGKGMPDAALIR